MYIFLYDNLLYIGNLSKNILYFLLFLCIIKKIIKVINIKEVLLRNLFVVEIYSSYDL